MTIPANVLKILNVEVGATLELDVTNGAFTARPAHKAARKRYTLAELLRGVTPEDMAALSADTAWAREGGPVGRELAYPSADSATRRHLLDRPQSGRRSRNEGPASFRGYHAKRDQRTGGCYDSSHHQW